MVGERERAKALNGWHAFALDYVYKDKVINRLMRWPMQIILLNNLNKQT